MGMADQPASQSMEPRRYKLVCQPGAGFKVSQAGGSAWFLSLERANTFEDARVTTEYARRSLSVCWLISI